MVDIMQELAMVSHPFFSIPGMSIEEADVKDGRCRRCRRYQRQMLKMAKISKMGPGSAVSWTPITAQHVMWFNLDLVYTA